MGLVDIQIGDGKDQLPTHVDKDVADGKPPNLDVLALLQTARFRNVPFQVGEMSWGFEQQHSAHLYPDRDGGFIEATGRNPSSFTFKALFRNGIAGQTQEQYPGKWRDFVGACTDRTTGKLTHPEFGDIKVKCRTCRTQWDVTRRDGVDVEVEFVETTDKEDELAALLAKGPAYTVVYEAGKLDDAIGNVDPEPEIPDALQPSLLDSIKQLTGAIAMAKAGLGNIVAAIDSYANALNDLTASIESLNDPANFAVLESLRKLSSAVTDLGIVVAQKERSFTQVTVQRDAPPAIVASTFGNTLDDFLRLNPSLGGQTSVTGGTSVFVYAS